MVAQKRKPAWAVAEPGRTLFRASGDLTHPRHARGPYPRAPARGFSSRPFVDGFGSSRSHFSRFAADARCCLPGTIPSATFMAMPTESHPGICGASEQSIQTVPALLAQA